MAENDGESKIARGFLFMVFGALAILSLFLGLAVCLVAFLVLLVGEGEVREAAFRFIIAGGGWALFGWRLLAWLRTKRWDLGSSRPLDVGASGEVLPDHDPEADAGSAGSAPARNEWN